MKTDPERCIDIVYEKHRDMDINFNANYGNNILCSVNLDIKHLHNDMSFGENMDIWIEEGGLFCNTNRETLRNFALDPKKVIFIKLGEPDHVFCGFIKHKNITIIDFGKKINEHHIMYMKTLNLLYNDLKITNEPLEYKNMKIVLLQTQTRERKTATKGGITYIDLYCQTWIYFCAYCLYVKHIPLDEFYDMLQVNSNDMIWKQKEFIDTFQGMLATNHTNLDSWFDDFYKEYKHDYIIKETNLSTFKNFKNFNISETPEQFILQSDDWINFKNQLKELYDECYNAFSRIKECLDKVKGGNKLYKKPLIVNYTTRKYNKRNKKLKKSYKKKRKTHKKKHK